MDNKKNDPKSLIMIVSSMLIFGSIGVFRRNIPLSSGFLALARGLVGGLFILAFVKLTRRSGKADPTDRSDTRRLTSRQFLWLAATGALIGVNWMLLFEAYNHTTVAVATLCYYMQPTIVVLLSPLIFKEKLTSKKALCAAVAIIGMVLVSGVIGGAGSQGGDLRGVLLGLGAAALYASVVIMNKKISGVDAYTKTTIQLLSAGIVMIPYLLISNLVAGATAGGLLGGASGAGALFTPSTIVLLLILCLVHTGFAYLLYFGSMEGLRVQSIALLSYIDPVSALLFSALFLREPLTVPCIVGAVMIIGSAIISEVQKP